MMWEGMPTEADITLTQQQGRGDKPKKLILRKMIHKNEKTNTLHVGSCNNVAPQALLYLFRPDRNNLLTTADQSNTVPSGADPGSIPPLCNSSAELEHQRLASDQGVQWPGQELPDTPVTIMTQIATHTRVWSVSLVSKFGSRLPWPFPWNQNMLVEFTHDLFLTCSFPHFCCKWF